MACKLFLRAARVPAWSVALSLGSACHYDIDKLYRYGEDAGTDVADSAAVPEVVVPDQLIELFDSASTECVACANEKCSVENDACRGDEECTAFTVCLAENDDPAQREDCRERHRDWLGEPKQLLARDVSGPFAGCVLQQRCDTECGTRTDLACLGEFSWPNTSETMLPYRVRLADTNSRPVPGAEVRVCDANSPEFCWDQTTVVSDANGIVDVSLPVSATGAFTGYLEIKKDRVLHETLLRLGWPVARGGVTNVTVIPETLYTVLSAYDGITVDAKRGMLQLRMTGCSGWPVRGVGFSVDGQADDAAIASWYTGNQTQDILPSFKLTSTSDLGAGGVINVPPGRVTARATLEDGGQVISELTVPVRQNAITIVVMTPVPAL